MKAGEQACMCWFDTRTYFHGGKPGAIYSFCSKIKANLLLVICSMLYHSWEFYKTESVCTP